MINKVILQGRLLYEPEIRQTKEGEKICSVIIASQHDYSNKNEGSGSDIIKCIAWGSTAEYVLRYFKKGTLINIEGSIKSRRWKNEDEDKWHYEQYVRIDRTQFAPTNNRSRNVEQEVNSDSDV